MSWCTWLDEELSIHVVENVDVPVMLLGCEPSPWHVLGDEPCPCQPKVLDRDQVTGRRILGHKDPVQ